MSENNKKETEQCAIPSTITRFIKHSKTNEGELAKQYFLILASEGNDTALVIKKNILIKERFERYERYGFELLKEFKGYRLYKQVFSIKIKTLDEVVRWVNGL